MIPKLIFELFVPLAPPAVAQGPFCVKATMHFVAPGISILEKLHSLVKYFGTNLELKLLEVAVALAFDFIPESFAFVKINACCFGLFIT